MEVSFTSASFTTPTLPNLSLTRKTGICAGKNSIAAYLIQNHGFKRVRLSAKPVTPLVENGEEDRGLLQPSSSQVDDVEVHTFADVDEMTDFVTKSWRDNFVTSDIWDDSVLDLLLRKPFFILVSVDAPVSLRWKRFSDRLVQKSPVYRFFPR